MVTTYTYETTYEQFLAGELRRSQDIRITYTCAFGCPAQLYSPPEKCHEAEPDEVEIAMIEVLGDGAELRPSDIGRLTLWAEAYLHDELVENAREEEADAKDCAREHQSEVRADLARTFDD